MTKFFRDQFLFQKYIKRCRKNIGDAQKRCGCLNMHSRVYKNLPPLSGAFYYARRVPTRTLLPTHPLLHAITRSQKNNLYKTGVRVYNPAQLPPGFQISTGNLDFIYLTYRNPISRIFRLCN